MPEQGSSHHERQNPGQQIRDFCEQLWQQGDPWDFEQSEYEKARCARLIQMLEDRRYPRLFEIGCGAGAFTRLLGGLADYILAVDVSPTAIERGRAMNADLAHVEFRASNVMDYQWRNDGSWDLVVLSDTTCYLGWLYSFFDIAWLAAELFAVTRPGGRLLLANTMHDGPDKLLLPHITRTYRDLFRNVGYGIEREEVFAGTKNGVEYEILMSLFTKVPDIR
jgi:SAM-dependent methyltransferase